MQRVRIAARGIKRERIESYMEDLIEAGRLDEEDLYLWPYQDLRREKPRLV